MRTNSQTNLLRKKKKIPKARNLHCFWLLVLPTKLLPLCQGSSRFGTWHGYECQLGPLDSRQPNLRWRQLLKLMAADCLLQRFLVGGAAHEEVEDVPEGVHLRHAALLAQI